MASKNLKRLLKSHSMCAGGFIHPHYIHVSALQLCLLAKCFKPALPFLELDMMDICKENGAYDAKHFLCYYYYGGMIYTGLKNFERALYFYEQVLSFTDMHTCNSKFNH